MIDTRDSIDLKTVGAIIAISLSIVIAVLDSTIANVALPIIAHDFKSTESASILIINAYQFALLVSLLPLAALGKIIGNKRIFIIGIILFGVASAGCALSENLTTLTLFRIIQGLGASTILGINTALIKTIYPDKLLSRGLAINVMVVSVSAAAGPSIAAAILSVASWNWLFAINIPITIISLFMSLKFIPKSDISKQNFDKGGAFYLFLTFIVLCVIIEGITQRHSILAISILLLIFLTCVKYFIYNQSKKKDLALIPISIFNNKTFTLSLLTSMLSYATQLLAYVSLPFYFHNVLNKDPVSIGILLTAWPLATMLTSLIAGDLIKKINPNLVCASGLILLFIGTLLMTILPNNPSNITIIWRVVICGLGFGLFQSPNNYLIMFSISKNNTSIGSGLLGCARLLGQIIGAALVAVFYNISPEKSTDISLIIGSLFSMFSFIVSIIRYHISKKSLVSI